MTFRTLYVLLFITHARREPVHVDVTAHPTAAWVWRQLIDVVGVSPNPPDKAVVLCVDEKRQIQALDRTQPSLPLKKGRTGTMTHAYTRNGTTTLFAALHVLPGVVIGQGLPRHRNGEFLTFLRTSDRQVPTGLQIHMLLDNDGTHTHDDVVAWLNMVERWCRERTENASRRGVFTSVPHLIAAIEADLQANTNDPKPFVWTATAAELLENVSRGRVARASIGARS